MNLQTDSFDENAPIPAEFALCDYDAESHVKMAANHNPALSWSGLPPGTKSLVLLCWDSTAPTERTDVNIEGREVSPTLPRGDFYHWVLVDIPTSRKSIARSEFSSAVTPHGKEGPAAKDGMRQGINDYTGWFAGDESMEGDYYGYDGPCPPWNDTLVHHYHFTLVALDVEKCPVEGRFTGSDVREAIEGHALDEAWVVGTYTLNPDLRR